MNKKMCALVTGCYLGLFSLAASQVLAGASETANAIADQAMYKPVNYENANKKGPQIVVLPGDIKSSNATFAQKISTNNIADYGELELGKANFGVLERSDLGPLLNEITLGVNMGDQAALEKFKRGKFQSTKWFIKFDVLKAEPVAKAKTGFDGGALSGIAGSLLGGVTGSITQTAGSSIKTSEAAGIWIVGLRYKIMDANTSEQVATNYFEEKMELGAKNTSVLGISGGQEEGVTLDTMVQRLVQQAVADIDSKK